MKKDLDPQINELLVVKEDIDGYKSDIDQDDDSTEDQEAQKLELKRAIKKLNRRRKNLQFMMEVIRESKEITRDEIDRVGHCPKANVQRSSHRRSKSV